MGDTAALNIEGLRADGRYEELIDGLREVVRADRRTLTDPAVKDWCGVRWRNLFISSAAADEVAVSKASSRLALPGTDLSVKTGRDKRPDRQRVAERFLRDPGEEWGLDLPDPRPGGGEATFVICPGLINSMLPWRAFQAALPRLEEDLGVRVICADAHPMRSCAANVEDLVAAIEDGRGLDANCRPIPADEAEPPGDVYLIGYSKGSADALTLMVERPDLAPKIRGLYTWAGAVGGSFLADDMYERIKDLEFPAGRLGEGIKTVMKTLFPLINLDGVTERLDEYDVKGAVRDLTTTERGRFMAEHGEQIDSLGIPIFSITGATTALEVPIFQVQGYMAIAKTDPDNDMQVTQEQARYDLPMGTHLATLNAHHWDMSYDPFPMQNRMGSPNLDHPFPRYSALVAIHQLSSELGLFE